MQSDGSGKFEVPTGNPSIVDSTIQSEITVLQQAGLRLEGTIENEGEIVVSETSGGGSTRLLITDLVTLSGGGVVDLQSISDSFAANIDRSGATGTLSNVDNTIQGRGLVGRNRVQIANQSAGVINANDPDGRLTFDSLGTAINRGLFTASAGGELFLTGDIDNANGLIESQNDSTITLNGSANVIGGTLRNVGTGGFTFASGTVTDATFDGVFTVGQQLTLFLDGTINNQGEIVISETSGGGVAQLAIDDSVSLTGGGIVNLQSVSDAFTARITGSGGILTNVDNTIQGRGRIGFNTLQVINQAGGTIHANVAGFLTVDMPNSNPTFENEGTLKASNGGTLNFVNALENSGRMEGDSTIDSGETIVNAGTIAPGNSIGELTIGQDLDFTGDAAFEIELDATSGTAGTNWDQLVVSGDLDLDQADSITVNLISLGASGAPGALASFDPDTSFSIEIVDATSISGFSFATFSVDSSQFANSFGGSFFVSNSGSSLMLNYTPISLGDLNGDGEINLLDVEPFVAALSGGGFVPEADINQDGVVNLLDIQPFITLLTS